MKLRRFHPMYFGYYHFVDKYSPTPVTNIAFKTAMLFLRRSKIISKEKGGARPSAFEPHQMHQMHRTNFKPF